MNNSAITTAEAVFEQSYTVRYHELDYRGNIRPLSLLNYLQDTAGQHARRLGVSVLDLRPHGLTWVISRIHLVIQRYPRAGETLLVRTWPSLRQAVFTCREFELSDTKGNIAVLATTSWAVLDARTRRPVRLEGHLPLYPLLAQRAVEDDFAPLPQLAEQAEAHELPFRVLRSDLDINRHVNNTIYAGWALETVPDEVAEWSLTELEISFRAEALYGETVTSRCAVVESDSSHSCCLHQIINQSDKRELVRLRSRWRHDHPPIPGESPR